MAKEDLLFFQEVFYANNPLLSGLKGVQVRIAGFRNRLKISISGCSLENMSAPNAVEAWLWLVLASVPAPAGMFLTLRLPFRRAHAVAPSWL